MAIEEGGNGAPQLVKHSYAHIAVVVELDGDVGAVLEGVGVGWHLHDQVIGTGVGVFGGIDFGGAWAEGGSVVELIAQAVGVLALAIGIYGAGACGGAHQQWPALRQ